MVQFSRSIGFGITRNVSQTNQTIQKALTQLSSGKRITSFAADASGGAIATRLESVYRGINQQIQNEEDTISRLQVQEGGLESITGSLQRVRELQVQAGNPLLDEQGVQTIQGEIDQLVQDIQSTVEQTTYGDTQLIEPGEELAGLLEEGVNATGDLAATDAAIEEVASQRSDVGSQINAGESRVRSLQVAFENVLASQSQIADLDIAQGTMNLANQQILQQMSIGALQNFMSLNRQNVLGLLGTLGQ